MYVCMYIYIYIYIRMYVCIYSSCRRILGASVCTAAWPCPWRTRYALYVIVVYAPNLIVITLRCFTTFFTYCTLITPGSHGRAADAILALSACLCARGGGGGGGGGGE